MVGREHEDHLEELGRVLGQAAAEPQQGHDAADANLLPEHVGDGHAGVEQLLATVIRDGRDEGGRLADEAELLGPRVVDGDLGNHGLGLGLDGARLDQVVVDGLDERRHVLEGLGDVETGLAHAAVLHGGRLELRVGKGTGVAELNLGLEHARTGTDGPRDDGLGDDALLDGVDDLVLLDATDLTQQHEDLAVGIRLVPQEMVDKGGAGVPITANGHALVDAVGVLGDDVVQLVGHAARLGHVADRALAVELGGNNVVHHAARVADLEAAGLDAADGGGANDCDTLLLRNMCDLTSPLQSASGQPTPRHIHQDNSALRANLHAPGHPRQ